MEIAIASIDPNPEQPRREFATEALEQLSRSISQHGVLQPVVVRRAGERFGLIMGERRFRASQLAGRTKIGENNSVLPTDRVFFVYNHFHNSLSAQDVTMTPVTSNARFIFFTSFSVSE